MSAQPPDLKLCPQWEHAPSCQTHRASASSAPARRKAHQVKSQTRSKRCSLFSPPQHTEGFPQPLMALSKPGKAGAASTRARKLLWQSKRGLAEELQHHSSHTALHSSAGTEALGGKKSQQVLISYNLEMSINVSIKFQGV